MFFRKGVDYGFLRMVPAVSNNGVCLRTPTAMFENVLVLWEPGDMPCSSLGSENVRMAVVGGGV